MATLADDLTRRYRRMVGPSAVDENGSPFPVNAGLNPDTPQPRQPGANKEHINALSTTDPTRMSELDREFALGQGLDIDAAVRNRGDEQSDWERYFRRSGMEAYDPILRGQGGYSPEDREAIIQAVRLGQLEWTPEMADALQLTEEEQNAIRGDVNKAGLWFDPGYAEGIDRLSADRQRAANDDAKWSMRGAVQQGREGLRSAVDPNRLRLDSSTGRQARTDIESSARAQREAVDPNQLRLSGDFVNRYRMGDDQMQDLVQSAAGDVRIAGQVALDEIDRRVRATGSDDPFAYAATRAELERDTAANKADALLNARIAADAERAGRERDIEGMRLGAEQGYAGLRSNVERGIGQDLADVGLRTEGMRLGAEQGLAGLQSENERYLTSQATGVEDTIGGRALATERGIGDQAALTQRYNTDTGIGLTERADDRASQRGGQIATNRQDATALGQASQFQRGTSIADRLSGNTQTAADSKRADEREARGWLSGQQELASGNVNAANDQRIRNFGTQGGLMNQATQNSQDYDVRKSMKGGFWNSFKNSLGQTLGSRAAGGGSGKSGGWF